MFKTFLGFGDRLKGCLNLSSKPLILLHVLFCKKMPRAPYFLVFVLLGNVQMKGCSVFAKQILPTETLSVISTIKRSIFAEM